MHTHTLIKLKYKLELKPRTQLTVNVKNVEMCIFCEKPLKTLTNLLISIQYTCSLIRLICHALTSVAKHAMTGHRQAWYNHWPVMAIANFIFAARNGRLCNPTSPSFFSHCARETEVSYYIRNTWIFIYFLCVLYSTLLPLPPPILRCVGGCWDRTLDCCYFDIDNQTL